MRVRSSRVVGNLPPSGSLAESGSGGLESLGLTSAQNGHAPSTVTMASLMLGTPVALMRRARTQVDLELIPVSTRWLVRPWRSWLRCGLRSWSPDGRSYVATGGPCIPVIATAVDRATSRTMFAAAGCGVRMVAVIVTCREAIELADFLCLQRTAR